MGGQEQSGGETKIDLHIINDAKVQTYCPAKQLSDGMFFHLRIEKEEKQWIGC